MRRLRIVGESIVCHFPKVFGLLGRVRGGFTWKNRVYRSGGPLINKGMLEKLDIRESVPSDTPAIEALYPDAFPEEDLLPLVRSLLPDSSVVSSLVGTIESRIAGHVIFTRCGIAGITVNVSLLGPLAVAPRYQKQGIGSALVRAGLRRLEDTDCAGVFVLGDPRYYSRLGFVRESRIEPPFTLPVEWNDAWQSLYLDDSLPTLGGRLTVPRQWREPSLWAA